MPRIEAPASEVIKATQSHIQVQKSAYCVTFNKQAIAANHVMKDLAKFCLANTSCFVADPRVHAFNEGKRAVWLRIQQHLHLEEDDLYDLYGGIPLSVVPTNGE